MTDAMNYPFKSAVLHINYGLSSENKLKLFLSNIYILKITG